MIFAAHADFARHLVVEITGIKLRVACAGYNDGEDRINTIQKYMAGELDVLILSYQHCFGPSFLLSKHLFGHR